MSTHNSLTMILRLSAANVLPWTVHVGTPDRKASPTLELRLGEINHHRPREIPQPMPGTVQLYNCVHNVYTMSINSFMSFLSYQNPETKTLTKMCFSSSSSRCRQGLGGNKSTPCHRGTVLPHLQMFPTMRLSIFPNLSPRQCRITVRF